MSGGAGGCEKERILTGTALAGWQLELMESAPYVSSPSPKPRFNSTPAPFIFDVTARLPLPTRSCLAFVRKH